MSGFRYDAPDLLCDDPSLDSDGVGRPLGLMARVDETIIKVGRDPLRDVILFAPAAWGPPVIHRRGRFKRNARSAGRGRR